MQLTSHLNVLKKLWGIKNDRVVFGGQIAAYLLRNSMNSPNLKGYRPEQFTINFLKPTILMESINEQSIEKKSCPFEDHGILTRSSVSQGMTKNTKELKSYFYQMNPCYNTNTLNNTNTINNKNTAVLTACLKANFIHADSIYEKFNTQIKSNEVFLKKVESLNFKEIKDYYTEKRQCEKEINNLKKAEDFLHVKISEFVDDDFNRIFKFELPKGKFGRKFSDLEKVVVISFVSDFLFIEPALSHFKSNETVEYFSKNISVFRTMDFSLNIFSLNFEDVLYVKTGCVDISKKGNSDEDDKYKNSYLVRTGGEIRNEVGDVVSTVLQRAFLKMKDDEEINK